MPPRATRRSQQAREDSIAISLLSAEGSRSGRRAQTVDDGDEDPLAIDSELGAGAPIPPPARPPKGKKKGLVIRGSSKLKDKVPAPPIEPRDRLSHLSAELLAIILSHLSPSPIAVYPSPSPDLPSLLSLSLVCRSLVPHVQAHLYRDLVIGTRVHAHALHRTLHGNGLSNAVRGIEADVGKMSKTSSQWVGWFLFHSMHSLCGIIGSCRDLLSLTIFLPAEASAWTTSLCQSLDSLRLLHTLTKDLEPSLAHPSSSAYRLALESGQPLPPPPANAGGGGGRRHRTGGGGGARAAAGGGATQHEVKIPKSGAGASDGMDVGWRAKKSFSMWSVSQLIGPLSTLHALRTLRLCGISSDSSTSPPPRSHSLRLVEVVLVEVNITNSDLLHLLGNASSLKKLTLWRSSLLSKRGLNHLLKKCPNLVELRIGGSWFGAKEEDDTNFPLDTSLPYLPHLRLIHVSGSLISPAILLQPSTNLDHLLVCNAPSFSPLAIHSALVKMRCDDLGAGGSPVKKLTLPEMRATCEAKGVELEGGLGDEGDSDSD